MYLITYLVDFNTFCWGYQIFLNKTCGQNYLFRTTCIFFFFKNISSTCGEGSSQCWTTCICMHLHVVQDLDINLRVKKAQVDVGQDVKIHLVQDFNINLRQKAQKKLKLVSDMM